jgi:parvulin-like peptidyl-prolyl isomerase
MAVQIQIGNSAPVDIDLLESVIQYQLLPTVLKNLIIDQAIANVRLTPDEENIALQQFFGQYQLINDEQKQRWLTFHRMSPAQLEQQAVRQLKLEKFKATSWNSVLESDFLRFKPQLDQYVYSLIRVSSPELTQELYFRIQEAEQTFAELAAQYSEGTEAKTGGLVGPVPASKLHPGLIKVLSNCQPGQLCPPQRIDEWNLIVRLEQLLPAQLTDTVKQQLLEQRYQAWLDEQLKTVAINSSEQAFSEQVRTAS